MQDIGATTDGRVRFPPQEVAPLDYYLRPELGRLVHGHGNNEWHAMEEVRGPAQGDIEREWGSHRIFRCTACEDEIRIDVPQPDSTIKGR